MNQERNSNNSSKVVVVADSSKAIGKAIAMEFAKAGHSIVIISPSKHSYFTCSLSPTS